MDTPHLIWAIGLVLALLLTVVAVSRLLGVLAVAAEIKALAARILAGAQGIASHTDHIQKLPGAATPVEAIADASRDIDSATGQILVEAAAILKAVPAKGAS